MALLALHSFALLSPVSLVAPALMALMACALGRLEWMAMRKRQLIAICKAAKSAESHAEHHPQVQHVHTGQSAAF